MDRDSAVPFYGTLCKHINVMFTEYCEPIVRLPHMAYLNDSDCVFKPSPVGNICKGLCKEGYQAVGNSDIKCLASKAWSNFTFQCLRQY